MWVSTPVEPRQDLAKEMMLPRSLPGGSKVTLLCFPGWRLERRSRNGLEPSPSGKNGGEGHGSEGDGPAQS